MNIKKCNKGHFYNADRYPECPHCMEEQRTDNAHVTDRVQGNYLLDESNHTDIPPTVAYKETQEPQMAATIKYVDEPIETQNRGMVVGWLVGVGGLNYGKVHTLYTSDTTIENVVISFDMYSKNFVLNYSLSRNDAMLNNHNVVENEFLNYLDRIFINGTDYMLVTLCKDGFSWWQTGAPRLSNQPKFTYVDENYNATLVNAQVNGMSQAYDYDDPATSVLVSNTWRCLCCNAENSEVATVCRLCDSPRGY